MESMLRSRLQMRHTRLTEISREIQNELDRYSNGVALTEDNLTTFKLGLKQALEAFDSDLKEYLELPSPSELPDFTIYVGDQIKAEETLVKVNSIYEMYQRSLSYAPGSSKLPKLELMKFDGEILKWSEFWDKFEANIDSKNLKDVEKLSYLISSLVGPALEVVSGLTTTNDNYSIAVETLKRRFGSGDRVVDAHYNAIINLKRASDNEGDCRQVLDTLEKHLRVLKSLGENTESNHLRVAISSKFPEQVMYQVSLLSPDDQSVPTLRSNLHKVITALERSSFKKITSLKETPSPSTTEVLQVRAEPRFSSGGPRSSRKRRHVERPNTKQSKRMRLPCLFCNMQNHKSADCKRFKTMEERKNKIKGRCFRCLRRNHTTEACRSKKTCFRCKGEHLQLLCPKKMIDGEELESDSTISDILCTLSHNYTFLQTAVAEAHNQDNKKQMQVRLLLDSGSQRSYITEKVSRKLELTTNKEDLLLIYTFGASAPQETSSPSTEMILKTKRGVTRKMQVNIVPHITDRIPVAGYTHGEIDVYADDNTAGEKIDLLIGNDFYCSFLRDGKIKIGSSLYLIDTDLGWVVSGTTAQNVETDILSVTTYCQCHIPNCPYFTEPDLPLRNIDIKFLWSLESIGITDSPKATRQEEAVKHFNETVRYQNGRYEVKWPWVQYPPEIPSNFGLAYGRLKSLIKRLDEESKSEYDSILKEQLELGVIEVTFPHASQPTSHPLHYLPHHIVKQKGKKGRLVYDASAKTAGNKSLNECLYSGPSMLEDLNALLLKFRTRKVGIVADVEKAFLQVGLQEEDRDVTRFLWIKDLAKDLSEDNLLYLRFCRVPFGVISSPFLLTATIRHHMSQSNGDLLKIIADKCYVDNLVTGADCIQEATQIYRQTRSTFEQLAMNIRDWVSNDKRFMDMIPSQYKAAQPNMVKVLGLIWNVKKDNLKLNLTVEHFKSDSAVQTKREVLRTLARIYDPCGFVCPLILPMKIIFQDICERKLKWDARLPEDLACTLSPVLKKLESVTDLEIPRYIGTKSPDQDTAYQLHCFTDASKYGYAAVVYLRAKGARKTNVSFVMGKCHISQVQDRNELKIPRLELLGFLIGSRLLKYVKSSLDLPIRKEYLWSDSLVVLGWMRSNKLLPPFVANRVNEIKRNHQQTDMCYIHTKSNPADIATRPELWDQSTDLWFNGPAFLKEEEASWPQNRHYDTHQTFFSVGEALDGSPGEIYMEQIEQPEQNTIHSVHTEMDIPEDATQGESDNTDYNSLDESILEIKKLQHQHFPAELSGKKTNLMKNLNLFLDVDGILRCRGRMANTTWSYDMKYPVLLPKDTDFTNKIIKKTHESNYHVGASHTLSIIRKRYWIPHGRSQVQKALRRCAQCIKHGGGPYNLPATSALPPERVNYTEPFSFTGVDYFGPLYVSSTNGKEKRWVALFTCLAVRAIHLEVVKDLTAEECLLALRRFAATRNIPKRVYSDNATCFKLTSEVMTKPYCIEKGIQWKFIPQLAPWHGGFYERLVALVKHCLKRTLEKHLLNDSRLQTVMKEVEAVVNSRPLTRVGTEVTHILRPADFLSLGKCLLSKPSSVEVPTTGTAAKIDLIEAWKKGIKIIEEFKKMFKGQYLSSLRERFQHSPKQPRIRSDRAPRVGDIVQIKSDNKNRENWKVGKISALLESSDGKCRVAKVNVEDSVLTRSIGHLYPLEVDSSEAPQTDPNREETVRSDFDINSAMSNETRQLDHQDYELESHRDISLSQEYPAPMEQEPIYKVDELEERGGPEPDNEKNTPVEVITDRSDGVTSEILERQIEGEPREKRGAAVRAREKIREWTQHLFTILQ